MLRLLHRWPGLLAAIFVTVIALSGATLSLFPALETLQAPRAEANLRASFPAIPCAGEGRRHVPFHSPRPGRSLVPLPKEDQP